MPKNRDDRSGSMGDGKNGSGNRKKPGMNMKKVFAISFCIVLGVVLISGGVIYKFGHDLYSNVNYVADRGHQDRRDASGGSCGRNAQHGRTYRCRSE